MSIFTMKHRFFSRIISPCLGVLISVTSVSAQEKAAKDQQKPPVDQPAPTSSRVFLTNGDKLSGQPILIDTKNDLHFESDSLRQSATFPLHNIISLKLDGWKPLERPETLARVQLKPRFRENSSDTILGELHELTPESIILDTWYGGIITLKRSMVESLNIINNSPGSYFGPNNIKEWTMTNGDSSWEFLHGALSSRASGGIGKDIKLREKSHISFKLEWSNSMRFRVQLYSNDVSKKHPEAFYDINFNRNYSYLRTYGKIPKGAQRQGGGRWQQFTVPADSNQVQIDIYANRKTGTFTIYLNGQRASLLQSLTPDPENLGTGFAFVAEEKYPVKISDLSITPWNGTSLPHTTKTIAPEAPDNEEDPEHEEDSSAEEEASPNIIILNNGDEVPGTVGKLQDGRMIIETAFTPIRIPIKRIKSLSLGDTQEEPKKYAGDIRAWFHQGGFITLKLTSLQDGTLKGFSQAFGDLSLKLSAFNQIDFHIYDQKANKLRKEIQ